MEQLGQAAFIQKIKHLKKGLSPILSILQSPRISIGLLILFAIGLLIFSGYRSATLSMTHDESSTYLNYIDQPLFDCFYDPVCWGTANLHLTNSFIMQISVGLWGPHEFSIRLGNFLAHFLYLLCSILLVSQLSDRFWPRMGAFCLLNCSPYLLDFFSLARGYGLACSFTLMSIYFLFRFLQTSHKRSFLFSALGALLAVLSNFTFLNYFALWVSGVAILYLGVYTPFSNKLRSLSQEHKEALGWFPLVGVMASILLLSLMLYYPISYLKDLGEFNYGVNSLGETYKALIKDHLQGQAYFGRPTELIFSIGILLLSGFSLIWGLVRWSTKEKNGLFYGLISLLALCLIIGLMIQFYTLDSKYLVNRKALLFVPIFGVPVALFLSSITQRFPTYGTLLSAGVAIFCTWHLFRSANFVQTREWYYDAFTKEMVEFIEAHPAKTAQSTLGVYWIFSHSSNFYLQQNESPLYPLPYEKQLRSDSLYQFYYVEPGQGELLHPSYRLEKQFGYVGALYIRD